MMDEYSLVEGRRAMSGRRIEYPAAPLCSEALAKAFDLAKWRPQKTYMTADASRRGTTTLFQPDRPKPHRIGSPTANTNVSAAQAGDARLRGDSHLLFVGFDDAEEATLIALYAAPGVQLTFATGTLEDLQAFQHAPFEALAIQVERCVLFAPLILDILHAKKAVAPNGEVIAVADQIIANLADHLRRKGFASVVLPRGDFSKIFPTRVVTSSNRPPFSD